MNELFNFSSNESIPPSSSTCNFGKEPWIESKDFHLENYFKLYLFICVFSFLTSLAAIFANIVLIAAILTTPSLSSPSYRLITNQAFSDLVMGLYLQLQVLFLTRGLTQELPKACRVLDAIILISWTISWISALNSVFLSIDRYLAVYLGVNYKSVVTIKRVRIVIVLLWLSSAIPPILSALFIHTPAQNAYAIFGFANICFSGMSFCYFKALRLIRRHLASVSNSTSTMSCSTQAESLNNHSEPASSQSLSSQLEWTKYNRTTWTLIIVEAVFVALGVPVIFAWVYFFVNGAGSSSTAFVISTSCTWHVVAFINPVIHMYRMNDVRQACRRVIGK